MAAATQGYMPDILKTPGFFTAAIAADGDNFFEQAFKCQNDGSLLHPLDMGSIHQHQQMMRDAHNDSNNILLQTSNDRAFTPLVSYSKTPQYANPLRHPQIPSPPTSAIQSPHDWPYSEFDQHQPRRSNLHALATQNHSSTPQVNYGQVTPPDDQLSSTFDYDGMPAEFMQQQPAQALQQQPESNNAGKRKRSSHGSATEASPKSSKRSRRSTARSKAQTATQLDLHNPEDEKRSKFLERNRVAASKCRQKKKEWTNNLEARARDLQNSKNQLALIVGSLKNEVMFLKGQMLKHTGCGCTQIREYLTHEADNITSASYTSHKKFESAASPIGSAPNSRPGSVSDNSSERHVSRHNSFNLDELGSPYDDSSQEATSHSMHFKSEKELEALLTSQLVQDTSEQGIASRVSCA